MAKKPKKPKKFKGKRPDPPEAGTTVEIGASEYWIAENGTFGVVRTWEFSDRFVDVLNLGTTIEELQSQISELQVLQDELSDGEE